MRKDNTSQGLPSPLIQAFPWLFGRENTKDSFCTPQSFLLSRANRCEVNTQHELQSQGEHSHGDPLPTCFAHSDVTFGGFTHFPSKKTQTLRVSFSQWTLGWAGPARSAAPDLKDLDPASWSASGWAVWSWFLCSLCPHYAPWIREHNLAGTRFRNFLFSYFWFQLH